MSLQRLAPQRPIRRARPPVRRPQPLPDSRTQIDPLSITDAVEMQITGYDRAYIPHGFWLFMAKVNHDIPSLYFCPWPYQIRIFAVLFRAWIEKRDVVVKQTRQSGKTDPSARWLAYMVVVESCMEVICSTKTSKTRRLTRLIQRIMRATGYPLAADGIDESRFEEGAGYVALSGKVKAERESDTGHIILVDEAQDIAHTPIFGDLSPMRSGTAGIFIILGVGGLLSTEMEKSSLLTAVQNDPNWLKLEIPASEVIGERPSYEITVKKDRDVMPPHMFDANYNLKDYTSAGNALLTRILRYEDVYGEPFDPLTAPREMKLKVGVDWGNKIDSSVVIACGVTYKERKGQQQEIAQCVIYRCAFFGGMGYESQLEGIIDVLKTIPYDVIRHEENGPGGPMGEIMLRRLKEEGLLRRGTNSTDEGGIWQPVYSADADNTRVAQMCSVAAACNAILYQQDSGGFTEPAMANLRAVGVTYSVTGKMKTSHSDWWNGWRTSLYPDNTVRQRERAVS